MAALPVVMFVGLTAFNDLFTTTLPGYFMIAGAVVLLTTGGFWLSQIIKPKF